MEDINYDELDPGIRKLVRLLRDNGFDTTDSGDGAFKFEDIPDEEIEVDGPTPVGFRMACAEPVANVYMQCARDTLLAESERLVSFLKGIVREGLLTEMFEDPALGQMVPRVAIEAIFLPIEGVAMLFLHGISDVDLIDRTGPSRGIRS